MENCFSNLFENIFFERWSILFLSLTDPDILRRSKFADDEIDIINKLPLEEVHRQRTLKEYIALDQLEKQFSEK